MKLPDFNFHPAIMKLHKQMGIKPKEPTAEELEEAAWYRDQFLEDHDEGQFDEDYPDAEEESLQQEEANGKEGS